MVSFLNLWNNFTDIIQNAYDDSYRDTTVLPSELNILSNDPRIVDTAYVEINAAGAHIKYDQERLAANINYRHELNNISRLVRLLHHGTNTSRIAMIAFNSTDKFWGLWTMNFGDYFIAINRNKNQSYDFHAF
jgi:hypothetical protein